MTRLAPLILLTAFGAGAQTMLDQEQRLIDIHSLLLDLPAVEAPGALRAGRLGVGVEAITVPGIDGTTGGKRQITASDQTRVFPRPRLAYGLPAPDGIRAFVGASYIPPLQVRRISTHYIAGEAGIAWLPDPLRLGLRAYLFHSVSQSPVTEPDTRDTLRSTGYGAGLSGAYPFPLGAVDLAPYGGVGLTHVSGNFKVTSDAAVLTSGATVLALQAGLRLGFGDRWEGVAELGYYPGRLMHPNFRIAYLFDAGPKS